MAYLKFHEGRILLCHVGPLRLSKKVIFMFQLGFPMTLASLEYATVPQC